MKKFAMCTMLMAGFGCAGEETGNGLQTRVIAAQGGTVTAGGATLTIPPGALSQDTTITVTITSPGSSLPDSSTIRGSVFDLGPDGTTFITPATLTLPMDATPAANERAVISFLDPIANQWVDVASTVTGGHISAPISHFTRFAAGLGVELAQAPRREWSLHQTKKEPSWGYPTGPLVNDEQTGGEVRVPFLFGVANTTFEQDNGATPGLAMGEVYSSASGETFSAYVEAPAGDPNVPELRSGGEAYLRQFQSFVKRTPEATLRVVLSAGFLAASDHNGRPLSIECGFAVDNLSDETIVERCWPLQSKVEFKVVAYTGPFGPGNQPEFFSVHGDAGMHGFDGKWKFSAVTYGDSSTSLWTEANFTASDLNGRDPLVTLNAPLVLDIDLSSIEVCPPEMAAMFCGDKEFTVFSFVLAEAWNWRGRESGVAAFLQDPQNIGGTVLEMTGLEATNNPLPLPPAGVQPPLPCASGLPDPAAGVLQLSSEMYRSPEGMPPGAQGIVVTRTQGSKGAVSVTISASDGTAVAGVDYIAPATTVLFGDGDTAPRTVQLVTALADSVEESDKTVNLTLSEPGGCAIVGAQASAVLTITDDDSPITPPPRFTVGGTVNGLIGTLVLEDHHSVLLEIFDDGPFTFSFLPTPSGEPYSVRVFNQPHNPVQVCTVTNGTGVFTDHNVTDVLVTCVGQ